MTVMISCYLTENDEESSSRFFFLMHKIHKQCVASFDNINGKYLAQIDS